MKTKSNMRSFESVSILSNSTRVRGESLVDTTQEIVSLNPSLKEVKICSVPYSLFLKTYTHAEHTYKNAYTYTYDHPPYTQTPT